MEDMTLYNIVKLVSAHNKIKVFDWKDHSRTIYDNCNYIPMELRNRVVCGIDIDIENNAVEVVLSK